MKRHYRPKLDPKVDLVGATPEALVRALFRRVEPLPSGTRGRQPIVGNVPPVGSGTAPQSDKDRSHLVKRV